MEDPLNASVDDGRGNADEVVMKKEIAVLEGDGIGPEIVREAIKVIEAPAESDLAAEDVLKMPTRG